MPAKDGKPQECGEGALLGTGSAVSKERKHYTEHGAHSITCIPSPAASPSQLSLAPAVETAVPKQ